MGYIRTAATVDLTAAKNNYNVIKNFLPTAAKILAIVKADAYGHGAVRMAQLYESLGANYLGVACIAEAVELRMGGILAPILVVGPTPCLYAAEAAEHSITLAVYSHEQLEELQKQAKNFKKPLKIHIKVDTGMGRLGFAPQHFEHQLLTLLKTMNESSRFNIEGIFSHFSVSDEPGKKFEDYSAMQTELFKAVCEKTENSLNQPLLKHLCNSAGAYFYPNSVFDMVRVGIYLYHPGAELPQSVRDKFLPVMSVHSHVEMVKTVPAGTNIGYGNSFTTTKPTKIATVCIGYADGYSRQLSGCGTVLVHGQKLKVLGRVCMDQIMLDATDLPSITAGDKVTIVGRDGTEEITFTQLAEFLNTVPHELMCGFAPRVQRIYTA